MGFFDKLKKKKKTKSDHTVNPAHIPHRTKNDGLVNAIGMLKKAKEGKYAVAQININNLEWTKATLEVAQETNSPIILGVSEGAAKYMGGFNVVHGLVAGVIKDLKITVPVALHLDHGSTIEVAKAAVNAGFSSVMFDGSHLPIEDNCRDTLEVVHYAHSHGVSVEGEVGLVGGEEDGHGSDDQGVAYAKFEDCKAIVEKGHVDYLAASLGSVHGHYAHPPVLGYSEMEKIREEIGIPLVLHGGSGIPKDMIDHAINSGQCKINVNTEVQEVFAAATRKYFESGADRIGKGFDPRKLLKPGCEAIKAKVREKLTEFGSLGKA